MTLTQMRVAVRSAIMERATDTGLVADDAELDRWINIANRRVFAKAVKKNPDRWRERSAELAYPSPSANGLLFSAILAAAPISSICLVQAKRGDGNFYAVLPFEQGEDHVDVEPVTSVSGAFPFRWYVEGEALWLSPPPASAQTLLVTAVRAPVDLVAADEALRGRYPDFHDLVVLKAAQLLYNKDEQRSTPWDHEILDLERDFLTVIARSQGQETRRVRRRSFYRFTR